MKIISITEVKSEIVDTDKSENPQYRRHSANNWERLMGESWEHDYHCDDCKDIELAYQAYKKSNKTNPHNEDLEEEKAHHNFRQPPFPKQPEEEETLYVTPQKK